jgi:hypothetical protein
MAEQEARVITWTPKHGPNGIYGHDSRVGKIVAFSYHYVGGNKPYRLTCALPGYTAGRWHGTEDGVKRLAERVLVKWLYEFGAVLAAKDTQEG